MLLRDLIAWPPVPADRTGAAPGPLEGVLRRAEFVPGSTWVQPHVELAIEHRRRVFRAVYWHGSQGLLQRIVATLNACIGWPMESTIHRKLVQ